MKFARRTCPRLERLEDRTCPTISIKQTGSTLLITGTPTVPPQNPAAQVAGLTITETSQGFFQVQDYLKNKGTFPASTIHMTLTSSSNTPILFNFGGFSLGGNLLINAGNALQNSPGTTGVGIENGTIGGSLTFLGGSGNEDVYLGLDYQGHNTLGAGNTLHVGGDVIFAPKAGNIQTPIITPELLTSFGVGQTSVSIGGNLTVTNTGVVALSNTASVGGNLGISAGGSKTIYFIEIDGTVGKSVTITGNSGGTSVFIGVQSASAAMIKGSLTANLGDNGLSFFDINSMSTIFGDATITSGAGSDTYFVDGTINGSLSVNTGAGADSFEFSGSVAGNMKLTEGNGDNMPVTISGTVSGNLTITQGNGNNVTMGSGVTVTGEVDGVLGYTGGNGTDALSITPTTPMFYDVDVVFGTDTAAGSYTLTLNANDTVSGVIKGKGGNNTFVQGGATLLPTLIFIDFP